MDAAHASVTEPEPATHVLLTLDEAMDASRCGQKAASLAGLRRLGFEIPDGFVIPVGGSPPHAEIAAALARLGGGLVADLATPRRAAVATARVKLSGQRLARFDAALACAELVYAVREDNVLLTDQLPTGLLRRASLEAGRRLVALGRLRRKQDVAMLTLSELRDAAMAAAEVKPIVARRKAELAWVRANPGPMTYGPPPGKLPDVRGLPEAARRIRPARGRGHVERNLDARRWRGGHGRRESGHGRARRAPAAMSSGPVLDLGAACTEAVHRDIVEVRTAARRLTHRAVLRLGRPVLLPSTAAQDFDRAPRGSVEHPTPSCMR